MGQIDFKDKVIWITGASSGLGEALAHKFAEYGARTILSGRKETELIKVQSQVANSSVLVLDLLQPETFEEKVNDAISLHGQVDIIIHNGGVAQNALAIDTKKDIQHNIFDVNFFSTTELTQYLLPHFKQRKTGQIVVMSGVLGKVAMPRRSSYSASKAALHGYYDSLRAELLDDNIDVSILIPSFLNTNLTKKALKYDGQLANKEAETPGCSVNKAAKQVAKAVFKKKYQAFIGNNDKGRLLLTISQLFPSVAISMVLKQVKKVSS